MFIVFICKRSTVVKIIRYLKYPEAENVPGNQREEKDTDVKTFVAKHLLYLVNAVNVPIIDHSSVKKI